MSNSVIVFMNSFKSKLFINSTPFAFPNADSFVGLANYGVGIISEVEKAQ